MQEIHHIALSSIEINPWQPRTEFKNEELQGLADSIKQYGILQPLVVVEQTDGKYRLIAGERRFRAAKLANQTRVPVIVRRASSEEQLEIALVENIQRADLNAIERAKGYKRLMQEFGLNQEEVAKRMGKARTAVANALRLLNLPEAIQQAVSEGRLTEGHAKVIAGLDGANAQMRFFERVVQTGANVRDTEKAARKIQQQKKGPGAFSSSRESDSEDAMSDYRELLESHLGTKVQISERDGSGTLQVHFFSDEELTEIVKKIIGRD